MSNPQSPAPGTPSTVRGDAVLDVVALGVEESSDRCCTCHRGIDHENSIVIVRASSKSREIRRCRKCHNLRSAINRLAEKHGSLVKDCSKVDQGAVESFFHDHPEPTTETGTNSHGLEDKDYSDGVQPEVDLHG